MLKRISVAAALAAGFSSGAIADGLPSPYAPSYGIYNWSGLYIGAHVGWEQGDVGGTTCDPLVILGSFSGLGSGCTEISAPPLLLSSSPLLYKQSIDGWLGGAQVGGNLQIGRVVLGVELSGSWGDVSGHGRQEISTGATSQAACLNPQLGHGGGGTLVSCHADQDWTAQLLAKFGYALGDGRLLPYVTGGVALTDLRVRTSNIDGSGTPFPVNFDWGTQKTLPGAVVGGGLQYAVGGGVSLGVEYLYTQYAGRDFSNFASCSPAVNCGTGTSFTISENHDLSTQTVRLVLNYKFGEREPVPLK
jgi:opacity protein-like surface antigen